MAASGGRCLQRALHDPGAAPGWRPAGCRAAPPLPPTLSFDLAVLSQSARLPPRRHPRPLLAHGPTHRVLFLMKLAPLGIFCLVTARFGAAQNRAAVSHQPTQMAQTS